MHIEPCPACGYDVELTQCFAYREFVDFPQIRCRHCGIVKSGGAFRKEEETDRELMDRATKELVDSWNNQPRIKDLVSDIRWAVKCLNEIKDIPPREYTDEQGVRLSCDGCNAAAIVAFDCLKEIPESYKNEDSV